MPHPVRSQLLYGVVWNSIEKVLMRGASFLIGIILARILSPSDFGLIGMLAIFISVSNVFIEGGLAKALIQRKDCMGIDYSTAFVSNIVMSVCVYLILFFSAPWIALFYKEPILTSLTRVLALNFILGSINIVQRARLMSKMDFKSLAQINIISTIGGGIIGITMAYMGLGVWALVGQTILSTFILVFLFPFYSKWSPSLEFSMKSFRELFGFGSKLMLTGVMSVIMNNISIICIGRYYRSQQLGYYTRALQSADFISQTIYSVLGNVTFPVLSNLQDERDRLVFVYRKTLFFTAMFVLPIMVLCALLARPLVLLILTEKWLPCVVLMQWLFLARIFYPLSALNMNILNAIGRSDLYMKLDFSKIPLDIIILAISIPLGIKAIAIGCFFNSFICFFINAYLPGRILGYGSFQQLREWRYIILSVIFMALAVYMFTLFFNNIWIQLVVGGTIGLVVYLLCCLIFKVIDKNVIRMFKTIIK